MSRTGRTRGITSLRSNSCFSGSSNTSLSSSRNRSASLVVELVEVVVVAIRVIDFVLVAAATSAPGFVSSRERHLKFSHRY